ncbi:MAG: FHA domain-containing protein [Acidobacteriota bacterium]
MPDNSETPKKSITPDWLVQGALTRIGDMVDKLTGRSWKPADSLATSGLIERLKMLLDSEIKRDADGRSFVPHNIKLKMQWDKFATDSDDGLRKLENELLTAAVDHISDKRYYTYAPLSIEAKPDYFTEGVKLFVSFDKFHEEGGERELNVTIPATNLSHLIPASSLPHDAAPIARGDLRVSFDIGLGSVDKRFALEQGKRLSVGRTKENDVAIDHSSVSKMHSSLLLNSEGKLVIADTGSTNGTYLNDERIAYGKAIEIFAGDKVKFGAIDVALDFVPAPPPVAVKEPVLSDATTDAYTIGDMQFSKKTTIIEPAVKTETEPHDAIEGENEH